MTTVLLSCVENSTYRGWGKYNGGIKLFSVWTKLLRQRGIDAYMVTYDGTFDPWLMEHPPIISMDVARAWKDSGRDLKFMTGWIVADDFIALAGDEGFYFFDAEMAYTAEDARHHRYLRDYLAAGRVRAVGTHSRTIQAWYMAVFGITPHFIREWSDPDYWTPTDNGRVPNRIGYMDEGPHTKHMIARLQTDLIKRGLEVEFVQIQGDEQTVRDQMRTCDVFLGMNAGKSTLWGEGCPRSPQEAQHVGAIPVAFDVHGNHEYIINGMTGWIVPRGDIEAMCGAIMGVLESDQYKEDLRSKAIEYAHTVMTPATAWRGVKEFLDL